MRNYLKVFLFFLIFTGTAYGQSHVVTGKIIDEQGYEAIGATVLIKGTSTGVVTDINGVYQINIPNPNK